MTSNSMKPLELRSLQTGLSLIELMIAIAIGLILMLGFTVAFMNMKGAFTSQDQLAQLQDNERLALTVLTSTVQSAGYFPFPDPDPTLGNADSAEVRRQRLPAQDMTNEGHGILAEGAGLVGTVGVAPGSDTITTRYVSMGNDGLMDCLGRANTTPNTRVRMTNVFSISVNKELTCSVALDGAPFTAPVPLVSNVIALRVVYGTLSGGAVSYLPASTLTTAQWLDVKTARITITFANPFAGTPGQPNTIDWVQMINLMN